MAALVTSSLSELVSVKPAVKLMLTVELAPAAATVATAVFQSDCDATSSARALLLSAMSAVLVRKAVRQARCARCCVTDLAREGAAIISNDINASKTDQQC
ncbi:hypothetical protein [Bradyrhizobium sp. HKCCYLS20291]|uniref:hypothetical protein n=1 Tax=Bradyrhizobium sp. HKCCYLS20291 TaxID=3420766 RepID=UPI003EBADC9C